MKNINSGIVRTSILVIATFFFQTALFGQIQLPNSSFEQWTDGKPDGWDASNFLISVIDVQTVFKDTSLAHDGDYSAMLETNEFNLFIVTPTIPGILTLGKITVNTTTFSGTIEGGIPFTGKPSALKGYVIPNPEAGDSAVIAIGLSHWDGTGRDTIGQGAAWFSTAETSWIPFSVPISYSSSATPDSMNVIISSSDALNEVFVKGSQLWVDDLELEYGPIGIELPLNEKNLSVWADGMHTLYYKLDSDISDRVNLSIYSMNGSRVVSANSVESQGSVNLSALPCGVYILNLTTLSGETFSRKISLR